METTTRGSSNNNNSGGNISFGSVNITINNNGSGGGGNNSSSSNSNNNSSSEEISVSNLRKLYSSLLEELAPLHYELGTGNPVNNTGGNTNSGNNNDSTNGDTKSGSGGNKNANYRWKNSGTITVDGTDDTGYDYYYTPDDTVQSWRLSGLASSRRDNIAASVNKGRNKKFGRKANHKKHIEGGDYRW